MRYYLYDDLVQNKIIPIHEFYAGFQWHIGIIKTIDNYSALSWGYDSKFCVYYLDSSMKGNFITFS